MFQTLKSFCFFSLFFSLFSCGVNIFQGIDSKNPTDELGRLTREANTDPEASLKEAKKELNNPAVEEALGDIEKKIDAGTAFKDLTDEDLKPLRDSIPQAVLDSFKDGEINEETEETIQAYGDVMLAYSKTSEYNEIQFLGVLVDSIGNDATNLAPGSCPQGMNKFLDVAGRMRKNYCSGKELKNLNKLEMSALMGEMIYIEGEAANNPAYSSVIQTLKEKASKDLIGFMDEDNFRTYLLNLFLQIVYVSCEFVTDECAVNTKEVSLGGVKRLWDNLQLSYILEEELKGSDILPDLAFSGENIINDIKIEAEKLTVCPEYDGKLIYCAVKDFFKNVGTECELEERDPGSCQASE